MVCQAERRVRTACSVAVSLTPASHQTTILDSKEWPRHLMLMQGLQPLCDGQSVEGMAWYWLWALVHGECTSQQWTCCLSRWTPEQMVQRWSRCSCGLISIARGEIIWVLFVPWVYFPTAPTILTCFLYWGSFLFELDLSTFIVALCYEAIQYIEVYSKSDFPLFLSYNIPFTPVNLQPQKKSFVTVLLLFLTNITWYLMLKVCHARSVSLSCINVSHSEMILI